MGRNGRRGRPGGRATPRHAAPAASGGHAAFRDGRPSTTPPTASTRTRSLRDFDWGTTRRLPSGRVLREWELVRRRPARSRWRPACTFAAWTYNGRIPGPTLRCREGERLRITFVNGSAHPHTIHFHGIHPADDGRRARARRRARSRRAGGPSTSSTRCRPACTSTTATSARSPSTSPRACTARSSSTPREGRARRRRDGHGHERVRHELRPRQRGLRREHDRLRLHGPADRGRGAASWSASTSSTSSSTTSSTRSTCTATSSTTSRPGTSPTPVGAHRHGDALPGPARDPRVALPAPGRYMFHAHQSEFTELGWQGFFEVGVMEAHERRPPRAAGAAPPAARVAARPPAAAADRRGGRRVRRARRPGPRRAARPAGRGARRRAHGAARRATIELTVRNDGPDAVPIAQAHVNDAFAQFSGADEPIGRLGDRDRADRASPGSRARPTRSRCSRSTGGTIDARDPRRGRDAATRHSFFGLMALLGLYVGVIPVALGMLWLPWMRRIPPGWLRAIMALTVGLLAFLAIDATLEGLELAGEGSQAFGGAALVLLGAAVAFLLLSGVVGVAGAAAPRGRGGRPGGTLALLVARRDRAAQPRRGRRDRLGLLRRRARARRVPRRRLRAAQHDRGPGDRRAGRARAAVARAARRCSG